MEVSKIQNINYTPSCPRYGQKNSKMQDTPVKFAFAQPKSEHYRANFLPSLPFRGNAPEIKKAYIITNKDEDTPLEATKSKNSYIVEFDTQTELIYGVDAIKYLDETQEFEYDTQVIFPKKAAGTVETRGQNVSCPENSAILINAGSKAKVSTNNGYPMVLISKDNFDWYENYSNSADNQDIKNKFSELIYFNSHLYNGEFTPNVLLGKDLQDGDFLKSIGIDKNKSRNNLVYDLYDKKYLLEDDKAKRVDYTKNLLDKLYEKGVTESRPEGYIKFKTYLKPEDEVKYLKNKDFSDDEIKTIMPVFTQARNAKKGGLKALRNNAEPYGEDYVKRMKEKGILYNNKKQTNYIYWHELYANTRDLYNALKGAEFNDDEINEITEVYKKENASGYDYTGLKFANQDLAVYVMDEKLNNWTQGETNWLTNSTAISSIDNKTPFVGVSLVQDDTDETVSISDLREGECLHFHPHGENGKKQTEVYVISSGTAALNVVKNGKVQVLYLNEGDLAVVGARVMHEINSVKGEYEHIVTQVPSAFQYGLEFKSTDGAPGDYDKKMLEQEAISKLSET